MAKFDKFNKLTYNYVFFLFITSIFSITLIEFANGDDAIEIISKNKDANNDDVLTVKSKIHLDNIEKIGFIRVVGFINGEEFSKDIPLSSIPESTDKLSVKFITDEENEIVEAGSGDELFICAYHIKNNSSKTIDYFDCNEGNLQSSSGKTQLNLFKPSSQVYKNSVNFHNNYNEENKKSITNSDNDDKNKNVDLLNEEKVKVKIIVPLKDKKKIDTIKVMAMLKGQIQSEIIDVQEEFDKIDGYTVTRIFVFDRDTDIGKIQLGDRFHGCVSGDGLNPPEGTECEKRLIKHFDKSNKLLVR
ncbi:MAG: hypothetical protein ACPKPY_00915 [Nitrososphaeraceae archaeon]